MGHKVLFLCAFVIGLAPAMALGTADPQPADSLQFHALRALGAHYRYGGRSPETGFDCSGLVAHVYERAWGVLLPRSAHQQATVGKPVGKLDQLAPGDLVFYNTRNTPFSHVGIYVGAGLFIHAPRPGQRVRTESMEKPYWRSRFNGARRLEPPT